MDDIKGQLIVNKKHFQKALQRLLGSGKPRAREKLFLSNDGSRLYIGNSNRATYLAAKGYWSGLVGVAAKGFINLRRTLRKGGMNHVQLKTIPLKNNPIYNERRLQDAMADKDAARLEHDEAIKQAVVDMLSNNTELYNLFSDNPSFRQWLTSSSFAATYQPSA